MTERKRAIHGNNRKPSAERAEQQVKAYELQLRGWSLRDIGAELGVSHTTVSRLIKRECDSRVLPLADEYRKRSIDRLTIATKAVMSDMADGHAIARNAEVLGKLEERLSKMLGADAPAEQTITTAVTVDPGVAALIARAREIAAMSDQLKDTE